MTTSHYNSTSERPRYISYARDQRGTARWPTKRRSLNQLKKLSRGREKNRKEVYSNKANVRSRGKINILLKADDLITTHDQEQHPKQERSLKCRNHAKSRDQRMRKPPSKIRKLFFPQLRKPVLKTKDQRYSKYGIKDERAQGIVDEKPHMVELFRN